MAALYYRCQGHPEQTAVVLLHGLFGSGDNLARLANELAAQYYVVSIDLPDHGQSAHSSAFSFTQYSQAVLDVINELKLSHCYLVGHSLGGKVAMQLALSHAQVINKLVVLDISPAAYSPRHQNVFAGLGNVDLTTLNSRSQAQAQLAEYIHEPAVRQFLLKSLYKTEDSQWQWRFNLALLRRDYALLSAAIPSQTPYTQPCLFVKGALSDYLLEEHRALIEQLFPASHAKVIANTGHWLHAEQPLKVAKSICAFLAD